MCQKKFSAMENSNLRKLIGHFFKVLQGANRRLFRMIYFKSKNSYAVKKVSDTPVPRRNGRE